MWYNGSMKKNEIVFKTDKEDILSEFIKTKVPKRFYRFLKSSQALVLVNDQEVEWYKHIEKNSIVKIIFETKEKEVVWPKANKFPRIVFENENYLIVNKESGLLTIPTKANPHSLYQELVSYLGAQEIHILNRLDKETSGLVVVAKNRYAAALLEPTHQHIVRKYLCLVEGIITEDGLIDNFIVKKEDSNQRYVHTMGQRAVSHYKVVENYKESTLLEFTLETGRTHQIRVHTSYMGHPILGDTLYGGKENSVFCLTSYFVEFTDPFTKERILYRIEKEW